jgi:hypothetical protein
VKHPSGAPFYERLLALTTNIIQGRKRPVRDKHYSLLQKFVNYGQKKYYKIGPSHILNALFASQLTNGPDKPVFQCTMLERLTKENTLAYWAHWKVTKKMKCGEYRQGGNSQSYLGQNL